jgi:sodium/potassium-transporting ATPase subunit alpha
VLDPSAFPADFVFRTDPPNFPLEELCFVGLVSFVDPPRAEVYNAVVKVHAAGLQTAMVTGDHATT